MYGLSKMVLVNVVASVVLKVLYNLFCNINVFLETVIENVTRFVKTFFIEKKGTKIYVTIEKTL